MLVGSGLNGRAAADIDQREALEEMAIIKSRHYYKFEEDPAYTAYVKNRVSGGWPLPRPARRCARGRPAFA